MLILSTPSMNKFRIINTILSRNQVIYRRTFIKALFGGGSDQKITTPTKTQFYVPESRKRPDVPKTVNNEPILYKGLLFIIKFIDIVLLILILNNFNLLI